VDSALAHPVEGATGARSWGSRRATSGAYDRTGDCVRHAEATAEILERVPKRVQGGDHLRPGPGQSLDVRPLGDDAIGIVAGLDDVGVPQARPIPGDVLMRIQELLFPARLDPEPDGIERGHGDGLLDRGKRLQNSAGPDKGNRFSG